MSKCQNLQFASSKRQNSLVLTLKKLWAFLFQKSHRELKNFPLQLDTYYSENSCRNGYWEFGRIKNRCKYRIFSTKIYKLLLGKFNITSIPTQLRRNKIWKKCFIAKLPLAPTMKLLFAYTILLRVIIINAHGRNNSNNKVMVL